MLAFLLVIYDQIASQASSRISAAVAHGRDMLALSPGDLELTADHWLARTGWLRNPASYYYDLAHINITVLVFVACFLWRGAVYRRARTALVVINLIGLAVFLAYPVAPPRLVPGAGFIDIVAQSGTYQSGDGAIQHSNAYGSMPSLHAAWAIWVALTVMTMTGSWWLRGLAWLHVLLTFVVVIITGNHYLVDIVAGAATTAAAWAVAGSQRLHRNSAGAVEPG
ncbi:MAG: hypothetical protein JWO12_1194 [Frankiales bacterium]|nr:hypothetical protein [Frankiales bacterium]